MNNIKVKSVKFSGPATIVFFEDGTKAVTKCRDGDEYDINLGVSWAICKKVARDMGATVKDLITAVVPQESYRTMPTFTTRSSTSIAPDSRTMPTRTSTRPPIGCTDLSLESF